MSAKRQEMPVGQLHVNVFSFVNDRLLLGTGAYRPDAAVLPLPYNAMTLSWGMMGTVWNKPMVQVLVRPQRHTWSMLADSDSFTLGVLPPANREAHTVFGAVSGRDQDKFAAAGIHAEASRLVAAPSFAEASLMIECRIAYRDRLKPDGFVAPYIAGHYHDDWHWLYWGEVLGVFGKLD